MICKVKGSRYRPRVAQRVGRSIALLFHDCGTRRGWVVSSTPRSHFTPGKDPVPILQGVEWAPGPVWTGGKYRPHRDSIPDRPAHSQSLYRLTYRAHLNDLYSKQNIIRVIKSRRVRLMGHVARMGGGEVHTRFWWGNLLQRGDLEDPSVDGRIIFKFIFKKWAGEAWTGSSWLRIRTGGGHLWIR